MKAAADGVGAAEAVPKENAGFTPCEAVAAEAPNVKGADPVLGPELPNARFD